MFGADMTVEAWYSPLAMQPARFTSPIRFVSVHKCVAAAAILSPRSIIINFMQFG